MNAVTSWHIYTLSEISPCPGYVCAKEYKPKIYIIGRKYQRGDDMIIAVSDTHLGYSYSNKNLFMKFLETVVNKDEVECFVLGGDILDMWRRDSTKLLLENRDFLEKLQKLAEKREVYYVVGNHDYHMMELKEAIEEQYTINVSNDVTLECGDQEYYFIHGYQLEYTIELEIYQEFADKLCLGDDEIGSDADQLWNLFGMGSSHFRGVKEKIKEDFRKALTSPWKRLSDEDIDKLRKTIKQWRTKYKDQIDDKFIIYGHTHRPYTDEDKKEANTGSWVSDAKRSYLKKNTYITIEEDGRVEVKEYSL